MTQVMLIIIRFYRKAISPMLPASCRFTPSCSQYAVEAYTRYGFWKGTHLTIRRLARCHPWSCGGHDPVDEA
ncbi:MAG: membrane protein insertion efficiency factor YidD [Myxococcota bacterium]|nr:membrane protein insertion efficiency factor YidD [Myxococcota bacterium]